MNNPARPLKGLLFDKDGTLFDFQGTWGAWAVSFITELSEGVPGRMEKLAQAVWLDLDTASFAPESPVIAGTQDEVLELVCGSVPDVSRAEILSLMERSVVRAPLVPAVPLEPYLTGLRERGLALGIATNDSEAGARAHIGRANVTHLFDFIVGFDSGYGGKPEPGQLLAFAEQMGLAPQEIAMVGDSTHDLHAAHAAGMVGIGVLTGVAPREELSPHADVVLRDIGEIPRWLDDI